MERRREDHERFAERSVSTRAEDGTHEAVTFAIHHVEGGVWRVLRVVGASSRSGPTRPPEVVFEGFALEDALEAANAALEDEIAAAEAEEGDVNGAVRAFTNTELQRRLERWFFDRA